MKLKFEKEVENIINALAQLPATAKGREALNQPLLILSPLDKHLTQVKGDKMFPSKEWAKLRRQLSFLFEIFHVGNMAGHKVGAPETDKAKEEAYRVSVKMFKDIAAGTALARVEFVRIALRYGVLHLSDHEIQKLIDGNKA